MNWLVLLYLSSFFILLGILRFILGMFIATKFVSDVLVRANGQWISEQEILDQTSKLITSREAKSCLARFVKEGWLEREDRELEGYGIVFGCPESEPFYHVRKQDSCT